jgi:hypothetical protein
LVLIEADDDHEGCFDALTKDGRILIIEPEGLRT